MTDLEIIQDGLTKLKGYHTLINNKFLDYYKEGEGILGNNLFQVSIYSELYIFLLEAAIDWVDDEGYIRDDSPISMNEVGDVIDKSNELVKIVFNNPIIL